MAKKTKTFKAPEDVSSMAISIFDKARTIKKENPRVARTIDRMEREIRQRLESIGKQIRKISVKRDRDLVTILVINGFHRTADEVLIE